MFGRIVKVDNRGHFAPIFVFTPCRVGGFLVQALMFCGSLNVRGFSDAIQR